MCNDATALAIIHILKILHSLEPSVDSLWKKIISLIILGKRCKIAYITLKGKNVASEKPLFSLLHLKGACRS